LISKSWDEFPELQYEVKIDGALERGRKHIAPLQLELMGEISGDGKTSLPGVGREEYFFS
jgi:hypothetical protein